MINLLVTQKRFDDIETERYDSFFGQNAHYCVRISKRDALDREKVRDEGSIYRWTVIAPAKLSCLAARVRIRRLRIDAKLTSGNTLKSFGNQPSNVATIPAYQVSTIRHLLITKNSKLNN